MSSDLEMLMKSISVVAIGLVVTLSVLIASLGMVGVLGPGVILY